MMSARVLSAVCLSLPAAVTAIETARPAVGAAAHAVEDGGWRGAGSDV